jgi:hypothetical protein
MAVHRITVTLPADLAEELDRAARNRSRFVTEAIRRELDRVRREALRASLEDPHAETSELAEQGLSDWAATVAEGDGELLDPREGKPVRWSTRKGWVQGK